MFKANEGKDDDIVKDDKYGKSSNAANASSEKVRFSPSILKTKPNSSPSPLIHTFSLSAIFLSHNTLNRKMEGMGDVD